MQILFHSLTVSEKCAYLRVEIIFIECKTIDNFIKRHTVEFLNKAK